MSKAVTLAAVLLGLAVLARASGPGDVELRLSAVEDSNSYFIYHYRLVNSSTSEGVAGVAMVVSASSGHPASLPSTGRYDDLADGDTGLPPYAEVGPIVPAAWRADLGGDTKLQWYAPMGWDYTTDSVSPGDTLTGFGIRSSYLPGLRGLDFLPTMEACCTVPIDTLPDGTGVLPFPSDFAVSGWAVGPRYKPDEIVLDIIESQLATVCDDPLWIDNPTLCSELEDSLGVAEARLAIQNIDGARAALSDVLGMIQGNTVPTGDIELDAAYLLGLNSAQLLSNIGFPSSYPQSEVCVWSDSAATAYFTIVASGDSLHVASPFEADAEVSGVDPPNSSCEIVWSMPDAGTDTVDVSIRLDSVSSGSELSEIHSSGGLGMGDTISTWIGLDSLLFRHDGAETGRVVVILVDDQQLR